MGTYGDAAHDHELDLVGVQRCDERAQVEGAHLRRVVPWIAAVCLHSS